MERYGPEKLASRPVPRRAHTEERIGIVTGPVEMTSGGCGEQYTPIDGIKYPTWWNAKDFWPKPGDQVRYVLYKVTFYSPVEHDAAWIIGLRPAIQ